MACKKITKTNNSDSELIKTLEKIFDNEFKAEEAYAYFDVPPSGTSDFIEEFGNYVEGYKNGDPSFHERVDENGEPKLIFDESANKYYYLDKNKEKIFYPLVKRGLRSLFDYEQTDRIISRLALNYFKQSNLDFNNIKFDEGEKLPKLNKYIRSELEAKIKELNTQGVKGKVMSKVLTKSLDFIDEYEDKVNSFYKQISLKVVDNEDGEADLQTVSEEGKDPVFNKASFEQDSKQSLSTNIKLRLSLLEDKNTLDPVWNEPTFVPFNDVYSTLINNITNQVAIEGEDIFDLQRKKVLKLSFKKKYLTQLVDFFNDKRFTETDKNQFAQTFNIHKNNFIISELKNKAEEVEPGVFVKGNSYSVKEISESGSKTSIIFSEWGNNFRNLFLNDNNKIKKESSKLIDTKIAELLTLSEVKPEQIDEAKFVTMSNSFISISRSLGIELTEQGFTNYLDDNGAKAFNFDAQKERLITAINRTRFVLNKTAKYYKKDSKEFYNQFETQSIFKELAKAEAFFVPEGSDASIWTAGKNKWLYSYPSYLSTRIMQWKKKPKLLEDWYNASAYNQGSALAKYLLGLDVQNKDEFGNKIGTEKDLKKKRKEVSKERLEKLNLGIFNAFQELNGDSVSANDISFNDYLNDHINKVLANSYVRTTTPADKTTDYQIRTGFFIKTTTINDDKVIFNDEVLDTFFNYFNSEYNRMKEANAEIDAAVGSPENLRIHYHFKDGSNAYARNGNAFQSQYFPELSFDSVSTNPKVSSIKDKLYNDDGSIKHTSNVSLNNALKEEIKDYINDQLGTGLNETVETFLYQDTIEIDSQGEFVNKTIDKAVFAKYVEDNFENHNDAVIAAASDFYINGIIQNIEYSKLFTGDLAFYKNMVDYKKRVPGTYTDGLQLRLKPGEESFTAAAIESIKIKSPVFDKLVEMLGENGAKPYKTINSADAQAWITPERWKFLLNKVGKWSPEHDAVYEKMTSDINPEYNAKELKIMAQPLKGVYFYMNGKTPTYLKYSQAVLTKGFVKGTGLEAMFDAMVNQKVDELITIDGYKVGAPTPTKIHDDNGKVIQNLAFNKTSLSNAGWKLQQDLPIKTFKQTDVGSQIQKNIFAGLKFNRKLDNFYLDGVATTGQKVMDEISWTVRTLIDRGISELNEELGISESGKIRNVDVLYGALIRELERRGGSKNVIDALNKRTALYGMPQSIDKIISIYSSIMNDRLIKIKTNGGAFIQMSNFGISKDDSIDQGIIWSPALNNGDTTFEPTRYINEETGRVTIKPGGILISGSFIAKHIPNYKEYTPEQLFGYKDENGNFVEGLIDKEILENVIGYRIPNQGLSSNDALEIVGILPEENGDTVVAYTGITTKTGSDFDIDKMFIMMGNYTFDNGRLNYVKFDPNQPKSRQSKEALQNRLIEAYKAVLTNEKVIKDVMKPVDIEFIKDEINMLFKGDTSRPMFHFDSIEDLKLRYEFIGGKAGVGQEANALVDINRAGFLSLNKYYIGWGHSQVNNGKQETVFDKEFSQELSDYDLKYYVAQLDFKSVDDREAFRREIKKVKVGDSLTAILNAFVDIAKDPYITRGNWTTSTTNIGNLLLRAGVHPLYVVSFMSQPVIKEYIKFQSGLESITSKNTGDVKNKFRRKMVIDSLRNIDEVNPIEGLSASLLYQKIIRSQKTEFGAFQVERGYKLIAKVLKKAKVEDRSEETVANIMKIIKQAHDEVFEAKQIDVTDPKYNLRYFREQITGTPNSAFQLAIYDKFEELQKVSKSMKENVDFSKLDTNGMGKNISSLYAVFNLRQHILNKEGKEPKALNGLNTKLYNTPLGHYFSALRHMMKMVKANPNLFPQGQEKVQDMFNIVSDDLYNMPAVDEELMTELEKNYYSYTMANFAPFNMAKEEAMELINELPKKISELKKSSKGKYLILDELQVKREGKGSIIVMNNRKKPTSFEEKFTNSWRDLIIDNPKLGEDLIKYSFLTSGFRMNSTQFYSYIPNEYMLKEGINYFIPSFSKQDQEDFIDKFYLNNTDKKKYVPLVFRNEMVASDEETLKSGFVKDKPGKSRFYVQLESGPVYKLEGYDAENRGVYVRVSPLGKKVKGSVIVEYGMPFIERKNSSKEELIKAFKNRIVKGRDGHTKSFQLEEIEDDNLVEVTGENLSEEKEIYNKLGNKTKSENVVITSWSNLKDATVAVTDKGIVATRIKNSKEHFGNPFSPEPEGKTRGLIKTETTQEAVEKYIDWVIHSNDERAQWIRGQLAVGLLQGKPILYYKELGEPSHATALDYLINKYDWSEEPTIKETPVEETSNLDEISSMSEITNHSGGAYGADTYWDVIGREYGVTEHKHYREGANSNLSQKLRNAKVEATVISKEELEKARTEVEKLLGEKYPNTIEGNLKVRNYYQVANSDGVFAIAAINGKGATVSGGTNVAVQLGIKMGKPTYVWNTVDESWTKYDPKAKRFLKVDTPILTKDFAGVGTRNIENYNVLNKETNKWTPRAEYLGQEKEDAAKQAIRDVYEKTQNSLKPSETKEEVKETKEYSIEPGRFVKYKDNVYIVTQVNPNDTIQIYNPKLEGVKSKISVSKKNLTTMKEKGSIVTYKDIDYIVTPNNTIISMKTNKKMDWNSSNKDRNNILDLVKHGIYASPKIDTATIVSSPGGASTFTPANKQQAKAIKKIKDFIENGDPDEIFVLEGKAGTGKTTIMQEALADAIDEGKAVLIGALSNKAKLVLSKKLQKRFPGKTSSGSITKILGRKMDDETGEFDEVTDKTPPISNADVIVIDEASMVNEDALMLMLDLKKPDAKLIFLGDRGQLPPIRKGNDDSISAVFQSENKASLTERVRQGEESPILPFADYYWDNADKEKGEYNPVPMSALQDKLTNKGNLVFAENLNKIFDQVSDTFKRGVEEGDPNVIKVVTYLNKTKDAYNDKIRKAIFGEDVPQYVENDFIMFTKGYETREQEFLNGDEFVVKEVNEDTIDGFKVFKLGVITEESKGNLRYFYTIDNKDRDKFQKQVDDNFEKARALPKGSEIRKRSMAAAWAFVDKFAAIDHSYAISSHKSQGSTYENVIVDVKGINAAGRLSVKSRSRAIYTALTRASNTAIVIAENTTTHESNIAKALDVEGMKELKALWDKHSDNLTKADPTLSFAKFSKLPKEEQDKIIECYG